jgi:hypothetical protein
MKAVREIPGTISFRISSDLISSVISARPVTLPPGRPRLLTIPFSIGAPAAAKTMGIVDVASFAARVAGDRNDDIDARAD